MGQQRQDNIAKARQVFWITLGFNLLVAGSKLVWGFLTGALTMVADGFHSLMDASSNVIGIIALNISSQPPDQEHPYGHRKFEAMAAIGISFFMFAASLEVLSEAIQRLLMKDKEIPEVTIASYAIMLASMLINFGVAKYEKFKAKELGSSLLHADSEHTMSDLYVSITVLVALVAVQLKFPILDSIGSLIIVVAIFRAGYEIISEHLGILVDAATADPKKIEELVLSVPEVKGCHKIRSRGMDDHIFVDLHIQVDSNMTVAQAHEVSYKVEEVLENSGLGIADVLVHVEEEGHVKH